jgi:hypothetical protein
MNLNEPKDSGELVRLYTAIRLLADHHTKDDHEPSLGFTVQSRAYLDDPIEMAKYIAAWNQVRRFIGYSHHKEEPIYAASHHGPSPQQQ